MMGHGSWLWAQTTCQSVLTRCRVSGEDVRLRGREATVRRHPGDFRRPGAVGSTSGTSEDVPEGTDTPFGVSGASFGRSDSSQRW